MVYVSKIAALSSMSSAAEPLRDGDLGDSEVVSVVEDIRKQCRLVLPELVDLPLLPGRVASEAASEVVSVTVAEDLEEASVAEIEVATEVEEEVLDTKVEVGSVAEEEADMVVVLMVMALYPLQMLLPVQAAIVVVTVVGTVVEATAGLPQMAA